MKQFALIAGFSIVTAIPAFSSPTSKFSHPPFIPAPENAVPVMVIVELTAKDGKVLDQYLKSAGVIPTTRLASGNNYSWTVRDRDNSKRFVLIQQWNSKQQQQKYIQWRIDRGDLAKLRSFLTEDPVVRYLNPSDLTNLPSQVR